LEKFEHPAEEKIRDRVLREWKRIDSIWREVRLTIKSGDAISNKVVIFVENEDVAEEMGERDKENEQQRP